MLGDSRFLRSIRVRNVLSFGPDTPDLDLLSLNVLIGPNGSGKSNLIEAISLLQSTPGSLLESIQTGGGIAEWLWKGAERPAASELEATVSYPNGLMPLRHRLSLAMVGQRAELVDEAVENERPQSPNESDVYFYYRYQRGHPVFNVKSQTAAQSGRVRRELRREDFPLDQSVISQRKDPDQYPEITYLGNEYAKIRFFRDWNLGRSSLARRPQPTDLPGDFLREDAVNIALVLNELEHRPSLRGKMLEQLKDADGAIVDFSTKVSGGTIQPFLHYDGLKTPVPATRLSDGTFRYLILLALLCHPSPPPLVCLEEPELGLHPDLLPGLARLLIEASHRMQLVVTTHSDTLVDGLSQAPECVIVCEKHNGASRMTRRSKEELQTWLKEYGLGQLWRSGEIGGNRW